MMQAFERMGRERMRLLGADPKDEEVYSTTAFVTFKTRRYAEVVLRLQFAPHADEFVMSVPPEPSDIRWGDLMGDGTTEAIREKFGYVCAIGLYLGFMPITVTISSITNLEHIRSHVPLLDSTLADMPFLALGLEGILASFALTLFLSFLPTILMQIFDRFFILRADAWAQHKLQVWYFWFQIVFVLLVTIVGSSVVIAFKQIAEKPFAVFGILADSMPSATHFYLNFMVMQWVTHAMNLTRYINLVKYLAFLPILGEHRAKELSEPEDQDYYGFGSRGARWTMNVVIVLVFCQLSPLIALLGLGNFLICRLVYGYLMVYAEGHKPDLGGVFFVQQLVHLQKSIFIYSALMVGVLLRRGPSYGPVLVGVGAQVYMAYKYHRFHIRFGCWQHLPFQEVVDAANYPKRVSSRPTYMQEELDKAPDRFWDG
uniref:CSC1/OSCA1-like 7TM region domain-containing protein n=2 Tax=Alexandrium monilatum TaxID=311494 RepID=A0A7S4VV24_9DINO